MQSFESILKLLRNIYSDIEIKKDYKDCGNKDWKNDWFNDFPQILAMSELQKRYKKEEDEDPKRAIQMKLYNKLCKSSIPNSGSARSLYFEETITQLQAIAQFGGAGNCEPMAEYCLMIAIEKNKNLNLNCPIHYIRFPACENYEVLNVVALGEWPNKGCQIICPWLGTITEWQGSLKETKEFKHYNDSKIIFEVRIGEEMDALSQRLRDIQFTEQTTNTSKKSAENFKQKAKELENSFNTYFPELRADSSYHCKR